MRDLGSPPVTGPCQSDQPADLTPMEVRHQTLYMYDGQVYLSSSLGDATVEFVANKMSCRDAARLVVALVGHLQQRGKIANPYKQQAGRTQMNLSEAGQMLDQLQALASDPIPF